MPTAEQHWDRRAGLLSTEILKSITSRYSKLCWPPAPRLKMAGSSGWNSRVCGLPPKDLGSLRCFAATERPPERTSYNETLIITTLQGAAIGGTPCGST